MNRNGETSMLLTDITKIIRVLLAAFETVARKMT